MRKIVLSFLLLIAVNAFAQKATLSFNTGLLVGTNVSRMNFNKTPVPPPPSPIATYFEPSLRIGLYTNLQFSNRFSLRNEYIFSQVKNLVRSTNQQYKLSYVALPVLLACKLDKRISLQAGPELALLVSASRKEDNVTKDITHDTEERSIGLLGGAAYAFSSHFSFHARYQLGMNHIGIGQRSNVSEFKLEQVQLLLQVGL